MAGLAKERGAMAALGAVGVYNVSRRRLITALYVSPSLPSCLSLRSDRAASHGSARQVYGNAGDGSAGAEYVSAEEAEAIRVPAITMSGCMTAAARCLPACCVGVLPAAASRGRRRAPSIH